MINYVIMRYPSDDEDYPEKRGKIRNVTGYDPEKNERYKRENLQRIIDEWKDKDALPILVDDPLLQEVMEFLESIDELTPEIKKQRQRLNEAISSVRDALDDLENMARDY